MFLVSEGKFHLSSPCWFSPKHPPRLVLLKYPGGFQKLTILKQEFQLAGANRIWGRPKLPNMTINPKLSIWRCRTMGVMSSHLQSGCPGVTQVSYVTFQDNSPVTPLVCLLQNHQEDVQGTVPSPTFFLPTHSALLAAYSFWVAGTFPSKSRGSNPWHRIPRFEGENTFCLTWLSSFKYPTYTLTPGSKLAYLWGFYTEWMRKLFTVSK